LCLLRSALFTCNKSPVMKHWIKIFDRYACALLFIFLTGCLPYPHTTERSPEVSGTVIDARTRAPIQGAKVFLVQSPHHTTYTDVNGHFDLEATRNVHLGIITPGSDWPDRKDSVMEITHTNYLPIGGTWNGNAGEILLQPQTIRQ
jgi:hypothetical protein